MVALNAQNFAEFRRLTEDKGPQFVRNTLNECFQKKQIKTDEFSIRECFEGTVEGGAEIVRRMQRPNKGGYTLQEAATAVDTSAFSNITGQFLYQRMREKFELPEFLWRNLCSEQQTSFPDSERIPGVGGIGDKAEQVAEGEQYPMVGLNEEYVDRGKLTKWGFIVPVTREIIAFDRTGLLLQRADAGADWLSLNCEKRMLALAVGTTNNYKRNGTTTNTYLTSGAYTNVITSNALYDWTNVQTAKLTLNALTDPNTNEYIRVGSCDLLLPPALEATAYRIKNATAVAHVDNQANSQTIRAFSPNPVNLFGLMNTFYTNQYVYAATSSNSTWFGGDFKKAFCRFYAWDIETVQAINNSEAEFTSDIQLRFKTSMMDMFQVLEPRYLFKCTA